MMEYPQDIPLTEILNRGAGLRGLGDLTGFTVLRQTNPGIFYNRFTGPTGQGPNDEVGPFPNVGDLTRNACLEKVFNFSNLHKASYYRVSGDPMARMVFQSVVMPTPTPSHYPDSIPLGVQHPIFWFGFVDIPGIKQELKVGDHGGFFSFFENDLWHELEMVLTALSYSRKFQLIVEGDPGTRKPVLKVLRKIP